VELAHQPPELKKKMKINTEAWSQMMLELDKTLDEQQRQNLLDKLDLFIEELGELVPEKTASVGGDRFQICPPVRQATA
jgi:hypothetical protein